MYREFFAHSPLMALPVAALVIFIVVFARIVFVTFRTRTSQFDATARLPLDPEKESTP